MLGKTKTSRTRTADDERCRTAGIRRGFDLINIAEQLFAVRLVQFIFRNVLQKEKMSLRKGVLHQCRTREIENSVRTVYGFRQDRTRILGLHLKIRINDREMDLIGDRIPRRYGNTLRDDGFPRIGTMTGIEQCATARMIRMLGECLKNSFFLIGQFAVNAATGDQIEILQRYGNTVQQCRKRFGKLERLR